MELLRIGRHAITSGISQASVLGPVLFITYINDIDVGLNNFIAKFADDTKIRNSVISDYDKQSLQDDLCKTSAWSDKWKYLLTSRNYMFFKWKQEI